MHADAATIVAERRPKRRGLSRHRLDGRKRVVRRSRELAAHYTSTLTATGQAMTIDLVAAISRAAELVALAEQLRADLLRGKSVVLDDLVRTERLANLATRQLHLPRAPSAPTPSFSEVALR
jgi:hypothetical protein